MIFVFNVDNVVDLITNSSSELFIFKMDNGALLHELLSTFDKSFFKDENKGKPILLRNAKDSLFDMYIWSILPYEISFEDKENGKIPDLPIDMKLEDIYVFDEGSYVWYLHEDYTRGEDDNETVTKHRDKFQEWLDPNDKIWLLYIDDYMMTPELKEQVKQISTYERF